MRPRILSLLLFLFLFSGGEAAAQDVTFNNQVVRIFQRHCQTCHRPGNIGPFSLLTYTESRRHAFEILEKVQSREMPPWKPVNAHGIFEGERRLTDDEIATIAKWVEGGAVEGDAKDLPEPLVFPPEWAVGQPDLVVQPSAAYGVQSGSADVYRCFPMAVNSESAVNVRGYEVLPGNRAIVHHVLLFVDQNGQSAALDEADPGLGYTCFGGAGFTSGLGALGGWVPGASPQMFPLGTGVRIPAGARIVMQVHYSTAEHARTTSAPIDPDLTRIGLYLSPVSLQSVSFLPVVNPFFSIPAGATRHAVRAFLPILSTVDLLSIAPHMHLLGRDVTVNAIFPDGRSQQLIRIDDWDFHWQGNYIFREAIRLPAGTMVEMTAHYDNSTGNPKNPSNPPIAVGWGERTIDEMCLTFLVVKTPGTPTLSAVPFSLADRGTNSVLTQGSAQTTQVGYARVSNGGTAPNGLAIFSYRQNGTLISEAAVPASRLISRGRMYAETSTNVRSGVAIANPNSEPATVSFVFTNESGTDTATGSATIPPNGQVAAFLDETPFNGPRSFSGSFTLTATPAVAVVALRGVLNERSEFLLTTLPIADMNAPPAAAGRTAVFPHFADGGGWTTSIMLVNRYDTSISGTLRFLDTIGQPAGTLSYSIPGRSARQYVTDGTGTAVRVGTVAIVPSNSGAPDGSLVFSYRRGGVRVTEAGVPLIDAGTAFRLYVEGSASIQSGLAITNTASSTAGVRLELIDSSGLAVADTTITLAANAHLATFLNEIAAFQSVASSFRGLIRITSAASIAVTGLRSRINERGDFLITTTPPVIEGGSSSTAELFFPHFADAGGYSTQFILFTTTPGKFVSGNLQFLSQAGQAMPLSVR